MSPAVTPAIEFARQYDAAGNLVQTAAKIGATSDFVNDYQTDALGRITRILQQAPTSGNAVSPKRVDLTYDPLGRLTELKRYASTTTASPVVNTTFAYDATGRIQTIDHVGVVTHGYQWDAASRLTQYANSLDGVVDYSYDDRGQLVGADYVGNWQTDEFYDYDDNGNRELVTNDAGAGQDYDAGLDNRLTTDGVFTYLYDAEGNRTARFVDEDESGTLNSGDTEITQYEWDHRNRLVKVVERATFGGAITQQVDHAYDAFNRHVKRTVDPDGATGSDPVEQTFFLYELGQIVLQFDKAGAGSVAAGDLSHRYLWGPAGDLLLADEQVDWGDSDADGPVFWALPDHLGSVRDVVDSAGELRIHREFDGYGNVVDETHYNAVGSIVTFGTAGFVDVAFHYTGKLLDDWTGLQQHWNRWYDPKVGSWISQDYVWDGANRYGYVGNRSTAHIDFDGLPSARVQHVADSNKGQARRGSQKSLARCSSTTS